jgi:hypothetical protein
MRRDERASGDGLEPELEPALALLDREQHRLAVRPEREDSVEPGADEEVGVRAERVVVEPETSVTERCDSGSDRPGEPPTLWHPGKP